MSFCKVVGKIIKYTWKTINLIREIIVNLVFLLLILLIWGGWSLIQSEEQNQFPQEGVLVLNIEGSVVDSTLYSDDVYKLRSKLSGNEIDHNRQNSLFEITQKIEQATYDDNIKGMILKLDDFIGADIPSLQYIGKYLTDFRQEKKLIYAYGTNYTQSQYYLASYADKIYLSPQGAVSLYGFSANNLYYKTLLDNLKVQTHVFRVGTYKSAIEPLTRDDMSIEARENTSRWINTMWSSYLDQIADNRTNTPTELVPNAKIMLNRLSEVSGNLTEYAQKNKLVDKIASGYQFNKEMKNIFGSSPQLSIYDYLLQPPKVDKNNILKSQIGVIFVNGTITDGNNNENNAGSNTITKQLEQVINSSDIKAVVLRVNSPGGGVQASETIRTYVAALRQQNIPVVVSMGGMAASGGYWISTESDYIIASPNTITGSIGIFGIVPTFEQSLDHLGIHTDGVTTSPLANTSITQPLSNEMSQMIQMSIESGYNSFIKLVSRSRHIDEKAVDAIAQGQVWLGAEAKEIGLVDQLGDFDDAINKAAELANLNDFEINWLKQDMDWFNSLFADFSASLPKSMVEILYKQSPYLKQMEQIMLWDNLNDPQNRYTYCLTCIDIK